MSVQFDYLIEIDFIFETSLEYKSEDPVCSFDEKKLEV
jgi:hypothetical protein